MTATTARRLIADTLGTPPSALARVAWCGWLEDHTAADVIEIRRRGVPVGVVVRVVTLAPDGTTHARTAKEIDAPADTARTRAEGFALLGAWREFVGTHRAPARA